jgi:hypothetical protein
MEGLIGSTAAGVGRYLGNALGLGGLLGMATDDEVARRLTFTPLKALGKRARSSDAASSGEPQQQQQQQQQQRPQMRAAPRAVAGGSRNLSRFGAAAAAAAAVAPADTPGAGESGGQAAAKRRRTDNSNSNSNGTPAGRAWQILLSDALPRAAAGRVALLNTARESSGGANDQEARHVVK